MAGIDFNNQKGANLGDPKFEQDAVNLRTLNRAISSSYNTNGITATTILNTALTTSEAVITNLTASTSTISALTAGTANITLLQFEPITGFAPAPNTGLMFFDGIQNRLCIYTGNTIFDLVYIT